MADSSAAAGSAGGHPNQASRQQQQQQQQPATQPHNAAVPTAGVPESAARNAGAGAAAAAPGGVAGGAGQAEWNAEEIDRFSFDDSDRFEEDSMCSWSSEPESLCNNWRGWKRPVFGASFSNGSLKKCTEGEYQ